MKRNKLLTLFAAAMLWLGGQSASAITLTAVAGDNWGAGEGPAKLVDGQQNTKWGAGGNQSHYIILKAALPILPTSYVLRIANDTNSNPGRNWKTWKIYGANFASDVDVNRNASEWVLIDEKVDQTLTTEQFATVNLSLSAENATYYSYYKIEVEHLVSDGQYMQMDEFWFDNYTVDPSLAQKLKEFDATGINDYLTNAYADQLAALNVAEDDAATEVALVKLNALYDEVITAQSFKRFDLTGVATDLSAAYQVQLDSLAAAEDDAATETALNNLGNLYNEISILQSGGTYVLYNTPTWGDGLGSNLVDKDEKTKWGGNFPSGEGVEKVQYVAFRLPAALQPYFYKLVTGGDTGNYPGRNWKSWKLYGGNFNSDANANRTAGGWKLLDERKDVSEEYLPMKSTYPATFDFNQGVEEAYTYFKIEVTEAHNGDAIQMSELYLCTKEEFEAIRTPLVAAFDDFDVDALDVMPEDEVLKAEFKRLMDELKTTSDAVRLTKVYNDLVALQEKLEESAAYLNGAYRSVAGNTAWGDNENWTKLIDGKPSTKWGGGRPADGSYNIFKSNKTLSPEYYMLITGNDTKGSPDRNWARWKIYGANFDSDAEAKRDTSAWVMIDSKDNIGQDVLPAGNFVSAYFSVSEEFEDEFNYFKIEVDSSYNNGGSIQMSEFKFITRKEFRAIRTEYVDSLNNLKAEIFEGKEITEEEAAKVDAAILVVSKSEGEELLPAFAKACQTILDAPKNSTLEMAKGDAECILPSIKWQGNYKAWTWVANSGKAYNEADYNKIVGTPANDAYGKAWYSADYVAGTDWTYSGNVLPNSWADNEIMGDVYAIRYFSVEGEIPSTVYMPAAHDDAPCEYYINGVKIWSETDGWKEDEVVRLTNEQKALIKTDGSINVFAFHVHQNWGGRYADGGLYTAGNMVNDFNNDLGNLDLAIERAEADSIDAKVIEVAKAKSNYRGGIGYSRDAITAAYRLRGTDVQENIFKGSAPVDNGQYYIYNVGAKRYLTGGVDYGTHAAVNFAAQLATFKANGNGFRIHTNIRNNSDALNFNGFVDCGGDGDTWILKEVSTGIYNIARLEEGKENFLLGYTGPARNNWWQVDTDCTDPNDPNNQWILVSKEERDALLTEATEANPVDATYYIHAAGFDHWLVPADMAWPFTKWTWNNGGDGGWEPDFVYEVWHAGETEMSQTLEGLPAGKYIATVQGYYRDGDNHNDNGTIYQGERQEAYFFAGDAKVLLPNIAAEADKYPLRGNNNAGHGIVPDSREDAAGYFGAGLYKVSVETTVGEDGKLKIGAYKSANVANDWMVLDNFRLTFVGNPVEAAVSKAGYATFVAPWNVNIIPEGVEAYAAQVKEGYVHLEPVAEIPAGEAVVLKAAEGTYTMYANVSAAELGTTNDLKAATEEVTADGSQYILAEQNEVVGFAKAQNDTKIAAGKGYLVISSAAGVKEFYPFNEEGETAIESISVIAPANGAIYNISGQRISKLQKGINIVNGKKILK